MIKNKDLVGYWPFEGNANDASGNGNNGTVSGATLVNGKFGKGYSFNGTTNYIRCNDSSSLNLTDKFSLICWAKTTTITQTYQRIFSKLGNEDGSHDGYSMIINMDHFLCQVYKDDIGIPNIFNIKMPLNTWAHLAFTFDNGNSYLYVNGIGEYKSIAVTSAGTTTDYLYLGYLLNQAFSGLLDELKIYKRALTEAEIRADMLNFAPGEF